MGSLRLVLDDREVELADHEVHYLTADGNRLHTTTAEPDGGRLGYLTTILGRWFLHIDNVPGARGLVVDGLPVTNGRVELPADRAVVLYDSKVPRSPRAPRAPEGQAEPAQPGGPRAAAERSRRPGQDTQYTIGRLGTNADIEVDDPLVRARHATVRIDAKGRWWIAGPVYVDGVRQMSATLQVGDTFVVGQTVLTVSPDLLPSRDRAPEPLTSPRRIDTVRRRPSSETGLAVELQGVTVYGDPGKTRLDDVTLSIRPGELVAVVGPSGSGKSSLIKVLLGELPEDAGTVHIGVSSGRRTDPALRRRQVKYVPQSDDLYAGLTVRETLTFAARLRSAPDTPARDIIRRVDEVMKRLTLDMPDRMVKALSGGQKRRVSIGLELVGDPKLLLLDEPTSGLDPGKDRGVMSDLRMVAKEYPCTVVIVTHATEHLGYVDRVIVVAKGGRVRYVGPPDRVLADLGFDSWADLMVDLDQDPPPKPQRPVARRARRDVAPSSLSMQGFRTALLRQARVTLRRGPGSLAALFAVPLVCTIVAIVASGDGLRPAPGMTSVLAILVTVAALAGASLTYTDLVADSAVLRRDWRVGVETLPIVAAKTVVFGALAALLALVVTGTFAIVRPLPPASGYGPPPLLMLYGAVLGIMLASMGIGLLISAYCDSLERAVTLSTLLAVLQVALSGALFELPWGVRYLTALLPARLGLGTVASYSDLNSYRRPAMYTDWLWNGDARHYWFCTAGLAVVFAAAVAGAVVLIARRWRNERN
ncbi:ATP-binding cassette domain-containing protein [Dactylosporangium sp. CA-092794]|uniref:ATP-binding cassette domain-containing protein n=1 Tax=Dactylosporangium sp. CA-092794 TaxID=3239929 RepID=UPI003D89EE5B